MTRAGRRHIPSFSLYGEGSPTTHQTDPLHIEDIQSRSRKYLWTIGSHRHMRLCQCVFVGAGPAAVDLDGSRAVFEGPAMIIIPSGTVHGFRFGADTHGFVLTTDLDRLLSVAGVAHQALIARLFSVPRAVDLGFNRTLSTRAGELFETLLREFRQPENLAAPVSGWLACAALWMLASGSLEAAPAGLLERHDMDRLRRFRVLIESHYPQHWPVRRYARQLAVSESSLNRLCRSLTGSTAFDVIQRRLALEARRRLVYVAGSIASIAAELGFRDPAYFCRFFRKHTGLSPSGFRRRQGA
ncbi:MAG: AraC family transcriptional regulator [Gammaproteobacteria bacterium]|nr:AraC family transcriptional regulator [Gammaproteobacteria bacterium]